MPKGNLWSLSLLYRMQLKWGANKKVPLISFLKFDTKLGFLNIQRQLFGQLSKAFSVIFGNAVFSYGFPVLFGGISFVLFPVVHRKFFMDFGHVLVPVGFCQN